MRIIINTGSTRKRPRAGDTKVVKGVTYVRQIKYAYAPNGERIGFDCTGGRQRYEWVKQEDVK